MAQTALSARFEARMDEILGPVRPDEIGVAVSGGGDSLALLDLAAAWARPRGVGLFAVTVDHGLRRGSDAEAVRVGVIAGRLGVPHVVMHWPGGAEARGNLQDAARRARLHLIDRWRGRLRHVLLGHTRDDQAETLLMRLRRGSGVEGLAAMAPRRQVPSESTGMAPLSVPGAPPRAEAPQADFWLLRPLLGESRDELRAHLRARGLDWIEDPSNADMRFERVRMRALMPRLAAAGLDAQRLSAAAEAMARARQALHARALDVAERAVGSAWGDLLIDRSALAEVEAETRLRLLAEAVRFVASAEYPPRLAALERLEARIRGGAGGTLGGVLFAPEAGGRTIRAMREPAAVAGLELPAGEGVRWDRRWLLRGAGLSGLTIRALGEEGLAQLPRRPAGMTPASLPALPALWSGRELAGFAPARFGVPHRFELAPPAGAFGARWRLSLSGAG